MQGMAGYLRNCVVFFFLRDDYIYFPVGRNSFVQCFPVNTAFLLHSEACAVPG